MAPLRNQSAGTGSSAIGNCTQAKLHYKHGQPQNLSTHGSLSQNGFGSPTFLPSGRTSLTGETKPTGYLPFGFRELGTFQK